MCCVGFALPRKLVLTQSQNVSTDLRDNLALVLSSSMLQDVLNHIITILVLKEVIQLRY